MNHTKEQRNKQKQQLKSYINGYGNLCEIANSNNKRENIVEEQRPKQKRQIESYLNGYEKYMRVLR